jgi:uncharacterized protein (DUF58 family)
VIRHRRSTVLVYVVAAIAGVALGVLLLSAVAVFLITLGTASDWRARRSHAAVQVTHGMSRTAVGIDEDVEVWLTVENRQSWALPTVHFEDVVPEGLEVRRPGPRGLQSVFRGTIVWDAFHIGPQERVRHSLRVTARRRGRWLIGPARVWSRDPLGWALFERWSDAPSVLTVYPRLYHVPPGILAPSRPEGDRRGPPWHPPDPSRVVGIRPYQPGDPQRLIHPYATAHTGTLQVKRLEPAGTEQMELLVLGATTAQPWEGHHPDLLESLVSAAASVADQYLQTGKPLGFSLVGTVYGWPQGVSLPPARGARQWARVMTALAWVQPGGSQTSALYHRLEALAQRLKPGDHLVYTACFPRPEVAPYLQSFTRRGIRVTYMPVGPHAGRPGTEGVRVVPWTPGGPPP